MLIRSQRFDFVFLQETKVQHMNMQLVRSLGVGRFLEWEAVEAIGSFLKPNSRHLIKTNI